jgi:mannose-6-phosphate isomerase
LPGIECWAQKPEGWIGLNRPAVFTQLDFFPDNYAMLLYPLKFTPRLVEKIWGGRKIESVLGKSLPPGRKIGESWEIYDFPPGACDQSGNWTSSVVSNGPLKGKTLHQLIEEFGPDLLDDVAPWGPEKQFPLLIKFLDAREDLSVQVHPDQKYAAAHPGAHLKTEAWYVIESEPGARIYKGLRAGTSRNRFRQSIERGECEQHLESIPVKPGDCHFLPSGTVHALGAGILVAEVQTPSDTTFRVYDFNRLENGKLRTLHVDQAMQCIEFADARSSTPVKSARDPEALVECDYLTLRKSDLAGIASPSIPAGRPRIWIVLRGEAEIRVQGMDEPVKLRKGETVLLPPKIPLAIASTLNECSYLEITLP